MIVFMFTILIYSQLGTDFATTRHVVILKFSRPHQHYHVNQYLFCHLSQQPSLSLNPTVSSNAFSFLPLVSLWPTQTVPSGLMTTLSSTPQTFLFYFLLTSRLPLSWSLETMFTSTEKGTESIFAVLTTMSIYKTSGFFMAVFAHIAVPKIQFPAPPPPTPANNTVTTSAQFKIIVLLKSL